LLLPANRTGLMLQHTGGDLAAARQGSLSAEGVRRTERVAAELFALRKAADECAPLSRSLTALPLAPSVVGVRRARVVHNLIYGTTCLRRGAGCSLSARSTTAKVMVTRRRAIEVV
jgi:hypothetical protein